jgi:flavin-binding protein dodecin
VTEISSSSARSFDDAVKSGVKRVTKTIQNVRGAWIGDHKVIVNNGKITEYRVTMRVSFVLKD